MTKFALFCALLLLAILSSVAFTHSRASANREVLSDRLESGQNLNVGETIQSSNGRFKLLVLSQGLFIYDRNLLLWSVEAQGTSVLGMQGDGNLVAYTQQKTALWNSSTFIPGSRAVLQNDGNFVIYAPQGNAVWATFAYEAREISWWPSAKEAFAVLGNPFENELPSGGVVSHDGKLYKIRDPQILSPKLTGVVGSVRAQIDTSHPWTTWGIVSGAGPNLPTGHVFSGNGASSGSLLCLPGLTTSKQLFSTCTSNPEGPASGWTGPHYLNNEYAKYPASMAYFKGRFVMAWTTNDSAQRVIYSTSLDGKTWMSNKTIGLESVTSAQIFSIAADRNSICISWIPRQSPISVSLSCADDLESTWSYPVSINATQAANAYSGLASTSLGDQIVIMWPRLAQNADQRNVMQFVLVKRGKVTGIAEADWTSQPWISSLDSLASTRDQICLVTTYHGTDRFLLESTLCRPIILTDYRVALPNIRR